MGDLDTNYHYRGTWHRIPNLLNQIRFSDHTGDAVDDMIRRGLARDHADLARLGCIGKERISQIMRLVWLAPDIQQEILTFAAHAARRVSDRGSGTAADRVPDALR